MSMPADSSADSVPLCHTMRLSRRLTNRHLSSSNSLPLSSTAERNATVSSFSSRQKNPFELSDACQQQYLFSTSQQTGQEERPKWPVLCQVRHKTLTQTQQQYQMNIQENNQGISGGNYSILAKIWLKIDVRITSSSLSSSSIIYSAPFTNKL